MRGKTASRSAALGLGLAVALACGPGVEAPPPGVLRINLGTEPPTLDWTRATDGTSLLVIEQLMRGLTALGPDLRPEPALAERWDVSPDGRTYTFHLRPGVRWSDGAPLHADQFVDSWRRLLDPETGAEYAYFLYGVENAREVNEGKLPPDALGVRARDAATFEVRLAAPLVYFPAIPSFMVTYPIRRELVARHGDLWTEPENLVTLGPFTLAEWRHEYRLALAANPDFYGGRPPLDRVVAYMVNAESTALVLFEQGLLDFLRLPPLEIRRYVGQPSYRRLPLLRGYYFGFDVRRPPFDDARVRRAFSMAIDRSEYPPLLEGGEEPAAYWIPPGMPHHNPSIGLPFDPERARALLREAGVDPAALPPVRVVYNTLARHKLVAEKLQAQWQRALGVRVELENREWKVFLRELATSPPPVFRLGWGADFPDPDNFMSLFTGASANNHTGWKSERYDDLVLRAARETDPGRRQALYDEAQRILLEEDAAIAPVFVEAMNAVVSPRVSHLRLDPLEVLRLERVEAR